MTNASGQRAIELFRGQFTPDGNGYIYRRSQKGVAIKVSAGEYQGFIETFARTSRRLTWGFVAGFLVIVAANSVWSVGADVDVHSIVGAIALIGPMLVAIIAFVWLFSRSYHRPGRLLERRVPVSGELSREEFRRQWFGSMRWKTISGQIGSFLAIGVVIVLDHDVLHGEGRLWLLLFALFALASALLVWRKLRYTVPTP